MVNIGQSHTKKFIFKDNTLEERINALFHIKKINKQIIRNAIQETNPL